ncbi:MAG: 50S ribosomal protein L1 [Candidatus Bipolaricaulota bacterium]|nr:50S ribosomal protein L1 [Candidatus Bipolaricaulota bacterium]
MKRGKRFQAAIAQLDRERSYTLDEAIQLLKETSKAGFDETVEVALNLGIKASHTLVRGTCSLPHGTGKTVRILAFVKGETQREAEEAGADYVGGEELAEKIREGWLEFDKVVASPDMMSVVGKLGRILGPRGLMPSPKAGTVTRDVGKVIAQLKRGMVEFRNDRYGVVHSIFGRVSFTKQQLVENFVALVQSILEQRPDEGVKGRYVRKVIISSTMGPGIQIGLEEIAKLS